MKKHLLSLLFIVIASNSNFLYAQNQKPKLVVGIVVDQMRVDYLERFRQKYSDGGFLRLMNEGFECRNNQYHYSNTVTGPGHAHVYSGSSPSLTGIVGNEWYDKKNNKNVYVVEDSTVKLVGIGSERAGKMSPKNLKASTITDQLKISSQGRSKVVGISIKDRGAILPAGHMGDAYWFDSESGNFITSSFYKDQLPDWVSKFNDKKLPEQLVAKKWETLHDIDTYIESEEDEQPYEAKIFKTEKSVFPYQVNVEKIAASPFGNDLILALAEAAVSGEKLGSGEETDFLAISFSSPDYVGHAFGPQSKEVEDVYLRLDQNISDLLKFLDKTVGKDEYTVFLTADHGVAEIPSYLLKNKGVAGIFFGGELKKKAQKAIETYYGKGNWILDFDNYQLYLNHALMTQREINVDEICTLLKEDFLNEEGVAAVVNLTKVSEETIPEPFKQMIVQAYNPKRSGEIMILLEPAWFTGSNMGTTHGTMYRYDSHVPLLWYGKNVNQGYTFQKTIIADIAPTVAAMLGILEPNATVGYPIIDVMKK